MKNVFEVSAIDVHAHVGRYYRAEAPLLNDFMTASGEKVVERARRARIAWSVFSPLGALLPRLQANAVVGNEEGCEVVGKVDSLLQWVVVNPLQPASYEQAKDILRHAKCVGIKIHPEEHGYPIREHGRQIYEFAAMHRAVILTHSGEENSLPADFVALANEFPEVKLILAHLGCGWDNDPSHQVRAILASRHDNLFVDTSSANSVMSGLVEWAVKEIGARRILFGTDTPLYSAPMQRARIDHAEISDEDKRAILWDNAEKLLDLKARRLD
jgi:uncharacterized protein